MQATYSYVLMYLNVVGKGYKAKLSDFGLARGVHEKDCYKVTGQSLLPVKYGQPQNHCSMESSPQPQMCGKQLVSQLWHKSIANITVHGFDT